MNLDRLHPADVPLWMAVEVAAWRLARAAGAPLKSVAPVPRWDTRCVFGYCYHAPVNEIQITLRRWNGVRWYPRLYLHQILDTISHEMAHILAGPGKGRNRDSHGPEFFRQFSRMLVLQEELDLRSLIKASGVKILP